MLWRYPGASKSIDELVRAAKVSHEARCSRPNASFLSVHQMFDGVDGRNATGTSRPPSPRLDTWWSYQLIHQPHCISQLHTVFCAANAWPMDRIQSTALSGVALTPGAGKMWAITPADRILASAAWVKAAPVMSARMALHVRARTQIAPFIARTVEK